MPSSVIMLGGTLTILIFFAPASVSALTLVQLVGLFHVVVGLLLAFTLGIFATGIGMWIARFNTWPSYRETAIRTLEWAVSMLFVLILLVALVYFIQRQSAIALPILAFIAIVAVLALIVSVTAAAKKKPPPPRGGRPAGGAQTRR